MAGFKVGDQPGNQLATEATRASSRISINGASVTATLASAHDSQASTVATHGLGEGPPPAGSLQGRAKSPSEAMGLNISGSAWGARIARGILATVGGLVSGAVAGAIVGFVGLFASPVGGLAAAAAFGGGGAWFGGDVGISLADKITGGTQQKDHLDQALNDLGGPEGFTEGQKTNLRKLKDRDWRELLKVQRPVKGQFRSNVVASKEDRQGIRKQLVKLIADGSTLEEAKKTKAELIESKKVVEPKEKGGPNAADVLGDLLNQ